MTEAEWADLGRPPDKAEQLVDPSGKPARLPRRANCPQCGAGPTHRVTSGMGPTAHVTCETCAYAFPEVTRAEI